MRFCRSLSASLATALALAALLVAPRARAADAPPAPAAPAIPATATHPAPATIAVASNPQPAPTTNSLPLPARDGQVAPQPDGNAPPPTNAPPTPLPGNAPPTGVAQPVTNPPAPPVTLPSTPEAPPPTPAPAHATPRSPAFPSRETKAPAPTATAAPRIDFSTFKILTERNIFDPNRSSRGSRYSTPASDTPPPRRAAPTNVEAFSLVGTLAYGENQLAFIDGGSTQFKKALRLNDTVADLKLKSVAASQATFDHDGTELAVRIGQGLRREDRGAWQLNTQPASYAAAPLLSTNTFGGTNTITVPETLADPAAPPAPGAVPTAALAAKPEPPPTAAEAEALRRLLEKRRKEEGN